ncbi:MAG: hypothetical protein HPY66_2700 [Firmicutes bacterium]|nr:hypothetical protein [Bacillota bacterium]
MQNQQCNRHAEIWHNHKNAYLEELKEGYGVRFSNQEK